MSETKNKVKFGLCNVFFVPGALDENNVPTYESPEKWPGAVSLSMEPQGDLTKFRADNIDYFVTTANNGYEGDLETALIPESFRKKILGEIDDKNGVTVETTDPITKIFALLFQFEGDVKATRHCFYNCTAARPNVESETTGDTVEPKTETTKLTASSVWNEALKKNVVKSRCKQDEAAYENWTKAVYLPGQDITPDPTPTPTPTTYTVTQNLTNVTSSHAGGEVEEGAAFSATLTADDGMTIDSVTVEMGGADITATAYDAGEVTIAAVTGNIVITATAV